jgi:hypothetical protein
VRFTTQRDYQTVIKFNNELVSVVVDTLVIIYKPIIEKTKTNSYGETKTSKEWYQGVLVPCLIKREELKTIDDMQTVNFEQPIEFNFLRNTLNERNIYPSSGDIIEFDTKYYEINTINEIQLWAGQVAYDHSVVCTAHLTRRSNLQLDKPQA